MFFNMYLLGTRNFAASLNFRFSDLLPLPHLLFVFTSASSSFVGICFRFLIFYLYRSVYLFKVTIWPAAGHGLYGRQYSDYIVKYKNFCLR
jgi:hypothetical protein